MDRSSEALIDALIMGGLLSLFIVILIVMGFSMRADVARSAWVDRCIVQHAEALDARSYCEAAYRLQQGEK